MTHSCIALTSMSDRVGMEELAWVAAALQTQVTRDLAPAWDAGAVIAAAPIDAMPGGFIPVVVQDSFDSRNVNGFHRTQNDDAPYIVVPHGPTWSLAASHEVMRMLVNPTGSARRPGQSRMSGQGTVEYLADVCAPCQAITSAYSINGVVVSDFCLPSFFDARGLARTFSAHTFMDSITIPFEPAPGGNVTWLADDGLIYQARYDHPGRVRIHGGFSPAGRGAMLLREYVDQLTPDRLPLLANADPTTALQTAEQDARRVRFTNLTRFYDDMVRRFGLPSTTPAEPKRAGPALHLVSSAGDPDRSGQQDASGDAQTTRRTAS